MSDWGYIVGGLFGIAMFMIILGNMGAADDIYDDEFVVIDSNEMDEDEVPEDYDFDVDRIRFTPAFSESEESQGFTPDDVLEDSQITTDDEGRLTYAGGENDEGENRGYITFDASDRDDTVFIRFDDKGGLFFRSIWFYVYDENGSEELLSTGSSPKEIDLGATNFNDPAAPEEDIRPVENVTIEIRENEDSWVNPEPVDEVEPSGSTGVASVTAQSVSELGKMVLGYIAFAGALPGLLGTFLRIFIGIFFLVFILKEVVP